MASSSSSLIHRITLFKIPREEDRKALAEAYAVMEKEAKRNNAPYILSVANNSTLPDAKQRSQGYTFVAQTSFASLDDMRYYDEECAAHGALKKVVSQCQEGVMTVFF